MVEARANSGGKGGVGSGENAVAALDERSLGGAGGVDFQRNVVAAVGEDDVQGVEDAVLVVAPGGAERPNGDVGIIRRGFGREAPPDAVAAEKEEPVYSAEDAPRATFSRSPP